MSEERKEQARASRAPEGHLPPAHLRDPGDNWAFGPNGEKYWGAFGAAGLLVWHPNAGVLMQHRAIWSHNGGTWALPGGARRQGETAESAARREAAEEAGVPDEGVDLLFEFVFDLGFWSYTTVVVQSADIFEPVHGDAESIELRWVPLDDIDGLDLHPGFAASWPELRARLTEHV